MFFRILIIAVIILYITYIVVKYLLPLLSSNSHTTTKEKSLLEEYNETESNYRTKQSILDAQAAEQFEEAQRKAAEAELVQEQINNKTKDKN